MRIRAQILALFFMAGCGTDLLSGLGDARVTTEDSSGVFLDLGTPRDSGASPDTGEDRDAGLLLDAEGADAGFAPDAELDAGTAPDAGLAPDATAPDATAADATAPDAGFAPDAQACGFDNPGPADKPRVVLIGQPFTTMPAVRGTTIRTLSLPMNGQLVDVGVRLDVGFKPERIAFVPSGELAIVLGEDGEVASVRVTSERVLSVVDQLALPRGGYSDLHIMADGQTIFALNEDVGATSGVYTLHLDCDGRLTQDTAAFYNLRLMSSMAFAGAPDRAVVLGGQAVFAPIDNDDLRIFQRTNGRWTQTAAFDLWSDGIDASRIAVSPDGRTLIVPNGSPFSTQGGTVMVADVSPTAISGPRLLPNMDDAREAIFSPDGRTALVTLLQPGRVVVLADRGAGFVEVSRVAGIGLAEQIAMVSRGTLSGRVILPSVDSAAGPNVASLEITGPGMVRDLGQVNLGMASEDIPGAVAVTP